jgi:hypothetical protein
MNAPVTRFFYDTEFVEDGHTIDLLSFGMVCETSANEFYHVNRDADWVAAFNNDWIRQNVMDSIAHSVYPKSTGLEVEITEKYPVALTKNSIARELVNYVETNLPENHTPEFWAYYAAYDHVAMAQLFGRMLDLPAFFPMHTMDLKQLAVMKGNIRLQPKQEDGEHNALADARHNLAMFRWLTSSNIPMREEWI